MMVCLVRREMLGQLFDPGREQRDLDLRRAAVIGGSSVGLYDFPLTGCWKRHSEFLLSLFPLSLADQINRAGRESKDGKEKRIPEPRNARTQSQKCETQVSRFPLGLPVGLSANALTAFCSQSGDDLFSVSLVDKVGDLFMNVILLVYKPT